VPEYCKPTGEARTIPRTLPVILALSAHTAQALPAPVAHDAATHTATVDAPAHTNARITFDASMLAFPVDLDLFAEGNQALPGTHRVDLYLNQAWKGKHDVVFARVPPQDRAAQACFDQGLLDALGLDTEHMNPKSSDRLHAQAFVCGDIGQLFDGASYAFDANALRLNVTAPQAVMRRPAHGNVDPSRWDAGIPAATLHYAYNGWHSKHRTLSQTSHYLGLRGGVNLGHWRVRYRAAVSSSHGAGHHYRGDTLTVERALPSLQSRLTIGDTTTDGSILHGVHVRGMTVQSDERMRPDAMNRFAPTIRGIAQSNAKVTIHQKDVQIFEMTVPPGPFVIDNLHPDGDGGDLLVTITEADGSARRFTVNYANLPELLRPGVTRYSAALGEYRSYRASHKPKLVTATLSRGINNTATAYSGLMLAQGYYAVTAGVGLNLSIGAVALDASYAHTSTPRRYFNGAGLRLRYSRQFAQTDTHIALTLAHDTNPGYYEPAQAFERIDQVRRGDAVLPQGESRSQLSASISQALPDNMGSLSVSGSVQDYWDRRQRDVQYHIGFGRSFGTVSASLTATRSYNVTTRRWDNQVMIHLSTPLDPTPPSRTQSHMNSSYAYRPGGQTAQTSVSATLGEVDRYHYNIYAAIHKSHQHAARANGGASLGWSTRVARMGASISVGSNSSQQEGLSASGGMVAFQDGVVFSPELGETLGIVQARYAEGAALSTPARARLDVHGHAIVPSLQPYRNNTVTIDPKGLSTDVELMQTRQQVVPTEGAVVLLHFETRHGYSFLLTGRRRNGRFLPFAAGVFDAAGKNIGHLGQGGQALVRVERPQGELQVRWGSNAQQQCRFRYDLDERSQTNDGKAAGDGMALRRVDAVCA